LSEFDDSWRDLDHTPAVDRWFARAADRRGSVEAGFDRDAKNGQPFTQSEIDIYLTGGGTINYGEDRIGEQQIADDRYYKRLIKRPFGERNSLFDIVTDCAAGWNSTAYLGGHQAIARAILEKPRNQRRRQLSNISTKLRRHQQAIRLVTAMAFDGIGPAKYCRLHNLNRANASRMLAHLYEKEAGLRDAIGAISACAAMTSWQNRQQNKLMRLRERGRKEIKLTFGWNNLQIDVEPWPCQASAGSMRGSNPGTKWWLRLIKDKSPRPDHPIWSDATLPLAMWNMKSEGPRYEPFVDPHRAMSRRIKLKDGKFETWRIARAIPSAPRQPLPCCDYHRRETRNIWDGFIHGRAVGCQSEDYPSDNQMPSNYCTSLIGRRAYLPDRGVYERRQRHILMCNPERRWKALLALENPLDLRNPYGNVPRGEQSERKLQPFTRIGAICWIGPLRRATAKDYADFFARHVTAYPTLTPTATGDNR
jgi:hypothetical protein